MLMISGLRRETYHIQRAVSAQLAEHHGNMHDTAIATVVVGMLAIGSARRCLYHVSVSTASN